MKIKPKAIEVTFSNGEKYFVHEPTMQHLGVFLASLPGLTALGKAMEAIQAADQGVMGVPVLPPDSVLQSIFPLFGVMIDLTPEEFRELPMWDGLAVLQAFGEFVPKNMPGTTATSTPLIPSNSTPAE